MLKQIKNALFFLLFLGCSNHHSDVSFYFWKSRFFLNASELRTLSDNSCKKLYIKYLDISAFNNKLDESSVTRFNCALPNHLEIIPVVFIRNSVFTTGDTVQINLLAEQTVSVINSINKTLGITCKEIQFDCDWTERTKENYFSFLIRVRNFYKGKLSATIRLHQVKFKTITGIPPVDKGALMYYNMGEINSQSSNSIYTRSTALKYIKFLDDYPLQLDIALPVFSWGIQLRNDKVVALLNKMNEVHFADDSNFIKNSNNIFTARSPGFKGGYYFMEGDRVRIESISEESLLEMADDLNDNLSPSSSTIIFYDLDSVNLCRYDKTIFAKIIGRMH